MALFATFGGTIFPPYKRNIHSFIDSLFMQFFHFVLLLIIFGYFPYWTIKQSWICCQSCKANRKHNTPNNEEDENMGIILLDNDDWIADRIEHPDNYHEQHVQCAPYDLHISQPQDITGRVTYGSISNPELTRICNSNIDLLPTRDTRPTIAVSKRLSIPLYPIASKSDDATNITVNEDIV